MGLVGFTLPSFSYLLTLDSFVSRFCAAYQLYQQEALSLIMNYRGPRFEMEYLTLSRSLARGARLKPRQYDFE